MSMRRILRKIARENGVSLAEVRTDMQEAIHTAYQNPPNDGGVTAAYQRRVPCKGEVPTPEELIHYAAGRLQTDGEGKR